MRNRLWYAAPASVIAAAAVAALLAVTAAARTSAAPNQVLQIASAATDVDYSDPALAYGVLSWEIEYNTCSKLVNYSDVGGRVSNELTPDAAAGMPVISKDGKTYTFTIRSGIKFSDGAELTAQSFKAAMDRDANASMNSPVDAFMTDVAGWDAVVHKKAKSVSGVVAKGNKLIIHLTQRDGGMIDKLAMPFFCAIDPAKTPVDPSGLKTVAGSGPYYIASRTVGKQLVMKVNPNYHGNRPHRASTLVFTMNTNPQQTYLQVSNGTYATDPNGLDNPAAAASLAKKYGINKSRFFVHPTPNTDYVALNTSRPTFSNVADRKAANFATDRTALLKVGGFEWGKPTTEILPDSLAGGIRNQHLYPLEGAELAKAKQLSGGKCGTVNLWYQTGPIGTPQAGIFSYDLQQMGCKVTSKPFQGYAMYTAAGVKGSDFDAAFAGWYQDYADGYDFFHILLDGRTIAASNNNNLAYFNAPDVDAKIDAANLLTGPARAKAWGRLDVYTMGKYAPWVPLDNRNVRDYVAPRVAGYAYNGAYGSMDLGTLYLK
ncbi:MAG TPA: ABC transporter substrate-binding protein [Gaiellaceae bacterium]|nr:ABC transporter substrate-binding protein [Gaiellaceae bacterium]